MGGRSGRRGHHAGVGRAGVAAARAASLRQPTAVHTAADRLHRGMKIVLDVNPVRTVNVRHVNVKGS